MATKPHCGDFCHSIPVIVVRDNKSGSNKGDKGQDRGDRWRLVGTGGRHLLSHRYLHTCDSGRKEGCNIVWLDNSKLAVSLIRTKFEISYPQLIWLIMSMISHTIS